MWVGKLHLHALELSTCWALLLLLLLAGLLPELVLGPVMYLVLGSATALKLLCWAVCAALQSRSDSMLALAEVRAMTAAGRLFNIAASGCAMDTADMYHAS
jgi:hypothetical protein